MTRKALLSVLLAASMAAPSVVFAEETSSEEASSEAVSEEVSSEAETEEESTEFTGIEVEGEAGHYTYNMTDSAPSTWCPTDWKNSCEDTMIQLLYSGLYTFAFDEDRTGYVVVPELASALPEDVTAEYAGDETYGVPADATEGYAWKVTLNENATWEDGTPINADTFEYTLQQFLNPDMSNYRASSFYSGETGLANGYNYYMKNHAGEIGYASSLESLGYATIEEAKADGYENFGVDLGGFWGISEAGIVSIDDETEYRDEAVTDESDPEANVSGKYIYETYLAPGCDYESYAPANVYVGEEIEGAEWDQVGFIKNDDYTVTFVLVNPTTEFYFEYNMSSLIPLNEEYYEANKQQSGDLVKSSYGTSVDTTIACGPYKLVEYQADKYAKLSKNESWYGYSDGNHDDQYMTTDVLIQYIDQHTTEMSLFLQGKLDSVVLQASDIDQYGTSDYLYYEPQSYTSKLSLNGDLEALQKEDQDGVNHSILSYADFRHAISLSLDRDAFAATCTAGHEAGYGIINYSYTADPETGLLYRDTEPAIQTLLTFYGAEDESEITGYDKDAASALFQSAYDAAVADGILAETDTVEIDLHLYQTDETYVRICDFIQEAIDEATVGTDLEGKVTVNLVGDENYYDNMKTGTVDAAITTWGGSSMNPFDIAECYCTDNMKNEYSFHPETEKCTITVDGEEITKTYYDWYEALTQGEYKTASVDTKVQVLAGLELGWLDTYMMIPIYYRNQANMISQRTVYGTEEYSNSVMGYGGIAYLTYTMDDAEWEEYCAENNNQLTY